MNIKIMSQLHYFFFWKHEHHHKNNLHILTLSPWAAYFTVKGTISNTIIRYFSLFLRNMKENEGGQDGTSLKHSSPHTNKGGERHVLVISGHIMLLPRLPGEHSDHTIKKKMHPRDHGRSHAWDATKHCNCGWAWCNGSSPILFAFFPKTRQRKVK